MGWADGMEPIYNTEDLIDSREVIARIAHLEALEERAESSDVPEDEDYGEVFDDDERTELETLRALVAEASGYAADWEYGETLIRDSYFKEYAQDLAEDIGAVPKDLTWPACHIDWDAACDALKMDYTCVSFDGIDYWIR